MTKEWSIQALKSIRYTFTLQSTLTWTGVHYNKEQVQRISVASGQIHYSFDRDESIGKWMNISIADNPSQAKPTIISKPINIHSRRVI